MKTYTLILILMFAALVCCREEGFLPEGGAGSAYKFGGELDGNGTAPNIGNRVQSTFYTQSAEEWPDVKFNPAAALSVPGRGRIVGIPNAWQPSPDGGDGVGVGVGVGDMKTNSPFLSIIAVAIGIYFLTKK
jgi:hypothetical protein